MDAGIDRQSIDRSKEERNVAEPFGFRVTADGTVRVQRRGRTVKVISGSAAAKLAPQLEDADDETVQALLQRATGNYRRGTEQMGRDL
jgi:hypothetical protein